LQAKKQSCVFHVLSLHLVSDIFLFSHFVGILGNPQEQRGKSGIEEKEA
jgi:hypothetical protein